MLKGDSMLVRMLFLLTVFWLMASPCAVVAQVPEIEAEVQAEAPPPTIAILRPRIDGEFPGSEKVAREIFDVLHQDLLWSKAFVIFEDQTRIDTLAQEDRRSGIVDYAAWNALGIHYVVETAVRSPIRDVMEIDLLLHDIRDRRFAETKRTSNCPIKRVRAAIHRYSDLIVHRCTGRIGIARTRIAFVNYQPTRRIKEIFIIDYDGWSESVVQVTRHGTISLFPAWSPDGRCLAYNSYLEGWPDAFIHCLDRPAAQQVFPLAQFPGNNLTPAWNPADPDWLAISLSFKGNPDIYLIRRDGKKMRQLTTSQSIEEAPCFSPNGREIVFTSDRSGYPQIYVMNVDGTNVRRLVEMPGYACDTAQWSPVAVGGLYGSYKICFHAYPIGSSRGDIYCVNSDGSDLVKLTNGEYDNSNPSWSPDGQYIAFSSTRAGGKAEIWVMEAVGSNPRRVTYLPGQNLSPAWSPAPSQ